MAQVASATLNKRRGSTFDPDPRQPATLREGVRLEHRGQPRSPVRRLDREARRPGRRRHRRHAGAGQPAAWSVYIGSDDLEALSANVAGAGGTVAAPAFEVGDQGRMAVFQDPGGAFIGLAGNRDERLPDAGCERLRLGGAQRRGADAVAPFYERVFGWAPKSVGSPEQPYTEFRVDGHSIAGAAEMNPMVPAEVPNYWLVYFSVDDVDATHRTAVGADARSWSRRGLPGRPDVGGQRPAGRGVGLMKCLRPGLSEPVGRQVPSIVPARSSASPL